MKKITVLLLLFSLCISAFANDPVYPFAKQQKGLIKILFSSNKKFIITRENILEINKDKIKKIINLSFVCNDATVYNGDIAMATDSGIMIYSLNRNIFKPYLNEYWNKKVDNIITDALNQLWFSSIHEGAFLISRDSVVSLKIQAPVIYSIASTPDSNVWVGTNIGLYRILATTLQSQRYAEEGIEGYSIPDNIVERLYSDHGSNIWAQLAETVVFIAREQQNGEVPSFDYVGDKDNKISGIAKLNMVKDGYLFATTKGVIFVKNIEAAGHHHAEEIHSTFAEKGLLLTDKVLRKPEEWKDLLITNIFSDKQFTWFITEQGVWKVKNKIILAAL